MFAAPPGRFHACVATAPLIVTVTCVGEFTTWLTKVRVATVRGIGPLMLTGWEKVSTAVEPDPVAVVLMEAGNGPCPR